MAGTTGDHIHNISSCQPSWLDWVNLQLVHTVGYLGWQPLPEITKMTITKHRVNIETCSKNQTRLNLGQSSTFTYCQLSWMAAITCWFGLHVGLVYMLVWFTCWFCLHDGLAYMLVQFTGWLSLHFGLVYNLRKWSRLFLHETEADISRTKIYFMLMIRWST